MRKIISLEPLLPFVATIEGPEGERTVHRVFIDKKTQKVYKAQPGMGDITLDIKTLIWEEFARTLAE